MRKMMRVVVSAVGVTAVVGVVFGWWWESERGCGGCSGCGVAAAGGVDDEGGVTVVLRVGGDGRGGVATVAAQVWGGAWRRVDMGIG
ncbi:hypothetical protein Tco_1283594 [Tanacetum coccineum]